MHAEIANSGDHLEINFSGDISVTDHATFRDLLNKITNVNPRMCTFSMADVSTIDSAGIGMMLIAAEEAENNNWNLTLKSLTGQVKDVFFSTHMDKVFNIVD